MKKLLFFISTLVVGATAAQADCYRDIDGLTKCWSGHDSYIDSDSRYGLAQQYLCHHETDADGNVQNVCHWE